jgi:hypothetical protein
MFRNTTPGFGATQPLVEAAQAPPATLPGGAQR